VLAPCSLILKHSSWVLDREPARSFDLRLQDEELEHALISSEDGFERIASQVGWKRRHRGRVLDLEELVLSVLERRFEAVLAGNSLALEHCDVLESLLSDVIEFSVHVSEELVLLFLRQRSTSLALHFR